MDSVDSYYRVLHLCRVGGKSESRDSCMSSMALYIKLSHDEPVTCFIKSTLSKSIATESVNTSHWTALDIFYVTEFTYPALP